MLNKNLTDPRVWAAACIVASFTPEFRDPLSGAWQCRGDVYEGACAYLDWLESLPVTS